MLSASEKIKQYILLQATHELITNEVDDIEDRWEQQWQEDPDLITDLFGSFYCSGNASGIIEHFDDKDEVCRQMIDGSYVGWTYHRDF